MSSATSSPPQPILGTQRLIGKKVFVTGASSGIGRSTALLFARCGASVVLAARSKDKLEAAREACVEANKAQGSPGEAQFATAELDMRSRDSIDGLASRLPSWAPLSSFDILVSNAGLVRGREKVGEIDADEIDEVLETNVRGCIHLTQTFVREFRKKNSGHVICLGSIAGKEAYPGGSIYCASKFSIQAFHSSLLKELVDTQCRVTTIAPGMVNTEFSTVRFRGDKAKADAEYKGLQPLSPDDIAEDIIFVASRPPHVQVADVLVFPTNQASPYHSFRGN